MGHLDGVPNSMSTGDQPRLEARINIFEAICKIKNTRKILKKTRKEEETEVDVTEPLKLAQEQRVPKAEGRNGEIKELNTGFQRVVREDRGKYYNDMCKNLELENRREKTCLAFLKLKELKEKFHLGISLLEDLWTRHQTIQTVSESTEGTQRHRTKNVGQPQKDKYSISSLL